MRPYEIGDENKLAAIGFFLSLIGAEVMGLLIYFGSENYGSPLFTSLYLTFVPLIQLNTL